MSSLEFDLDTKINDLEGEWRSAYDASIVARADYQVLAANRSASVELLDAARERRERAESKKACIMGKIERLEDNLLGQG